MVIPNAPQNLVADNVYDSDKLDGELRRYGIELIAPHRMNRKIRPRTCVACDRIADVGRLNGCLRGYKISAGWLFVTDATLKLSWNAPLRLLFDLAEAFMTWLVKH
jgi:hypothetical protein